MKKLNLIYIMSLALCFSNTLIADELSEAFSEAKVNGELRLGFVSQDNEAGLDNKNISLGGSLGIQTKEIYSTSLGAKFYTTNALMSKDDSGSGTKLFSSNDEGYSILGEAFVNVSYENTIFKAGRQKLDTPYANDNDIRMIPNTFEAAKVINTDIPDTTLLAIYITKSAGVDSPIPEDFNKVVADGDGTTMLGLQYKGISNTKLSAWYNYMDGLSTVTHLEAMYKFVFNDNTNLDLGAQYANYAEQKNSLVDGDMYGFNANLTYDKLNLYLAYNATLNDSGKSVTNFFGGGRPFMTSMDDLTINGLNDVKAYKLGLGYDIIKNLNLSYYYANFDYGENDNKEYIEQDVFLKYAILDKLNALLVYTTVSHKISNTTIKTDSYNRFRGTLNYSF